MAHPDNNTDGRENNAAQPLGEREGLESKKETQETGRAERKSAGPDGARVEEVTRTFENGPKA